MQKTDPNKLFWEGSVSASTDLPLERAGRLNLQKLSLSVQEPSQETTENNDYPAIGSVKLLNRITEGGNFWDLQK